MSSSNASAPSTNVSTNQKSNAELSVLVITLLKGILYQDSDPSRWSHLMRLQTQVRDYVAVLKLELILDEAEGYAYLRSTLSDDPEEEQVSKKSSDKAIPRLIARRPLSFPASLLLALLRKKLAEFDSHGGDTRLIVTRDEIIELIRVFLPENSNEAKLINQISSHIKKVVDLGFLRPLKSTNKQQPDHYEVRRIIKAFVDAQWLSQLDHQLSLYQQHLAEEKNPSMEQEQDEDE